MKLFIGQAKNGEPGGVHKYELYMIFHERIAMTDKKVSILNEALNEITDTTPVDVPAARDRWAEKYKFASTKTGKYCLTKDKTPQRGKGFQCFDSERAAVTAWKEMKDNKGIRIVRESAEVDAQGNVITESMFVDIPAALKEWGGDEYAFHADRVTATQARGKFCLTRDNPPIRGRGFQCFDTEKAALDAWKTISNRAGIKIVRESADFDDAGNALNESNNLFVDTTTLTESPGSFGRGPDHRGLGQELAHERNNYAVVIDGKVWKVFADQHKANGIAQSIKRKNPTKKVGVSVTAAAPTANEAAPVRHEIPPRMRRDRSPVTLDQVRGPVPGRLSDPRNDPQSDTSRRAASELLQIAQQIKR